MPTPTIRADFVTAGDYLAVHAREVAKGGLFVRGVELPGVPAMAECVAQVFVAGQLAAEVPCRLAAYLPGTGVAVMFQEGRARLEELAERLRQAAAAPTVPGIPTALRSAPAPEAPAAPAAGGAAGAAADAPPAAADAPPAAEAADAPNAPRGTLADRLRAMNPAQKMALALACDRETRFALLRDTNKVLHLYVFKNPRMGLDEVLHASKMTTLSPEAIKYVAEHKEWGVNPQVCTALVRNPKTPLPLAIRMLDRVPLSEVRAIAKGGARDQIVFAARKKIAAP